ncbi:hypothetical protein ABIA38_000370 [Embleya sp. AB8]
MGPVERRVHPIGQARHMTMPPSPGQGGYPGYGQQPGQGYPNNPPYPGQQYPQGGQQYPPPQNPYGGAPQYPGAGGGPQYPGNYGGGGYGGGMPPGPPQGGSGKGPLIAVVIAAIVVVGGIIATLVVVLGGNDKKDNKASPTTGSTSSVAPTTGAPTSGPPTTRPPFTTRPTTPRSSAPGTGDPDLPTEVQYVDLSKGDCVNLDTTSGTIDKKSCTTSHNGEVIMTFDLTGSTYPGEASITDTTETKCTPAMNTAVSGRADASQFTFTYTFPKQPGWDIGRRKVTCIAKYKSGQTLTKPLR